MPSSGWPGNIERVGAAADSSAGSARCRAQFAITAPKTAKLIVSGTPFPTRCDYREEQPRDDDKAFVIALVRCPARRLRAGVELGLLDRHLLDQLSIRSDIGDSSFDPRTLDLAR